MSDFIDRQKALKYIEKKRQDALMMIEKKLQGALMTDNIRKEIRIMNAMDLLEKVVKNQPSTQQDNDMIHLQKEQAYLQGWEEGREALRKEMWENGEVNWFEKQMKKLGYKGCRNCKHQIDVLRSCEWLERGGDGVLHLICPKWEKREVEE